MIQKHKLKFTTPEPEYELVINVRGYPTKYHGLTTMRTIVKTGETVTPVYDPETGESRVIFARKLEELQIKTSTNAEKKFFVSQDGRVWRCKRYKSDGLSHDLFVEIKHDLFIGGLAGAGYYREQSYCGPCKTWFPETKTHIHCDCGSIFSNKNDAIRHQKEAKIGI